jgi:hypothetical protein
MSEVIQISIPKAVVTSVYTSDSNGNQYIQMSSPAGEFKFSCPAGVHDFNKHLEDNRQTYSFEISGNIFDRKLGLTIHNVLAPIGKPKN